MGIRVSRAVEIALLLGASSVALPSAVLAQHGVSMSAVHGGGVAAHAGPVPSYSGPAHGSPPPSMAAHQPQLQIGRQGHWPSWTASHPADDGRHGVGYRGPYVSGGYFPFSYGLPMAYGLANGDDQQEDASGPAPAPQQPDPPVADYGQEPEVATNALPVFRPAYQEPVEAAPVHGQPATTLIFKDGRPPALVHNYALTGSTLYALDGEARQEIPLALLNVAATVEVNRAAGVDFALPVSR